jgi:hypothetical protein
VKEKELKKFKEFHGRATHSIPQSTAANKTKDKSFLSFVG